MPKYAHGTINLQGYSNTSTEIIVAVMELYDRIIDTNLLVRRVTIAANHVISEEKYKSIQKVEQLDLFMDIETEEKRKKEEVEKLEKERRLQEAILHIHGKYGKNALLKGSNLLDGAAMKDRNMQVGGHKT